MGTTAPRGKRGGPDATSGGRQVGTPGLAAPHVGGGGCGDSSVEEPGVSDVDSGQALLGCYPLYQLSELHGEVNR